MIVYCVALNNAVLNNLKSLFNTLSNEEVHYGFSIKNPKVKTQYLLSKLLTRLFLSKHVGFSIKPKDWVFAKEKFDKPQLSPKFSHLKLFFNVAHCDNLYSITLDDEAIGIDVEPYQFRIDDNLANTVFSDKELAETLGMEANEKCNYFLKLWTIKESFAKESGLGINTDFHLLSAEEIEKDFFKISSISKINNDILTKNIELEIEDVNYSLSISARAAQFSAFSVEILNDKNWYFEDIHLFSSSNLQFVI